MANKGDTGGRIGTGEYRPGPGERESARSQQDGTKASPIKAGAAKVDITGTEAGPANDPLYVKALVLKKGDVALAIVTVDAVAIAEIGSIRNDYLGSVRRQLTEGLGLDPTHILINASHCHGVVCGDVVDRTVRAVKEAWQGTVPVRIGVGKGREDRIVENRRLRLKNGREADVRRAYALPPDEEVAGVGPVDPEIGILRLDGQDGQPLAVVYNFACHPIQGVPGGGNTADLTGFASRAIEDCLGGGAMAFFLQGCTGDVNPVRYKDVDHPRDAEPLGALLGLSTVRAAREIQTREGGELKVIHEVIDLPRADLEAAIQSLEAEKQTLVKALRGTDLNLKTFVSLVVKHGLSPDFPSAYSHRYLHERSQGRDGLDRLDADNRDRVAHYLRNIHTMEQLTRVQTNLNLLEKHQAQNQAAGQLTVRVEVVGVRVGDFVLVTFPGELSVQIGLDLKKRSPHRFTFVAAYTNGYIYYAPTEEQLRNLGGAQEDSDCILGHGWLKVFEDKAAEILSRI